MDHPLPSAWTPPLSPWGHTWRLLAMVAISLVVWAPVARWQGEQHPLWLALDVALGLAAFVLVHLRRRRPLAIALGLAAAATVSGLAGGPATLAVVSLATHRRWRWLVPVAVANLASAQVWSTLTGPAAGEPAWVSLIVNVVAIAAICGWGMYVGSRRELLWTLRQRAERAEAEQGLRAERARDQERARIAREMHDVLAHRISRISMHAGALSYREDLDPAQLRRQSAVIQGAANEALADLRGVLGVLRRDTGEPLERPQPTWCDLPALVDEARAAGQHVAVEDDVEGGPPVPDAVGRAVYRMVQEGLTNAERHAPGSLVTIRLSGSPGSGLRVLMTNPHGFGARETRGAGVGLVGLRERAALVGGRLESTRTRTAFEVHAWLPWEIS